MTIGRNDPCPCGSGKKHKRCCLPAEEVISLDRFRADRMYETLLDRLASYVGDRRLESEMVSALLKFFGGPPPEDSPDESLEMPMDWAMFGYRSDSFGTTICEHFAAHAKGLTVDERSVAGGWANAQPGFFHVAEVNGREVHLRRLWGVQPYVVTASGTGLKTGDLVAAWLLPVPSGYRFGFALSPFPVEITKPLEHLLREEFSMLRRQRPDVTWDDLYRTCWPRLVDDAMIAVDFGEALLGVHPATGLSVQGTAKSDPILTAVADRLAQELRQGEAPPEVVEGALRLWWDIVHALRPRVTRPETWVGGVLYVLFNLIYGMKLTQGETGEQVGVSAATVGARARQIEMALHVEPHDARYVDLLHPLVRAEWRFVCLTAEPVGSRNVAPLLERALRRASSFVEEENGDEDDPEFRARGLIDEAWEATGKRRIRLARQAIELWPDAADAYVILGNDAMKRGALKEARQLYHDGMQAGERALGSEFFSENIGHFWGLVETRPYMRARSGLADALWMLGEREAAVAHYEELLLLNPGDNQGIRYVLTMRFLEMDDDHRLGRLLSEYEDDGMADILYTRALWRYRQNGPGQEANTSLSEATKHNPHVAAFLLGERPLPPEQPGFIGWGDETAAAAYALGFGDAWRRTGGALHWLASRTGR